MPQPCESKGLQYLTPEEIAAELRVQARTVRLWLDRGKLRGVKAGRQWRVERSDLEAFLHGRNGDKAAARTE